MIGGEWISRRSYTKDSFKDLKKSDDLISKRSATERLTIAKTLLETVLEDMHTAEPRRGTWKVWYHGFQDDKGIFSYTCSECGFPGDGTPYCSNCGARMETEA